MATAYFIANVLEIGRYLLLSLLAWLLWCLVIKPQLHKKCEAEKAAKIAADLKAKQDADRAARQKIEQDEEIYQEQTRQRVSAEIHTQRFREMVQKDPRVVAMVVRDWMSKEL